MVIGVQSCLVIVYMATGTICLSLRVALIVAIVATQVLMAQGKGKMGGMFKA